ncbi:MAG: hypothetical protein V2J24_16805, partial [Pseudomonadales bacterium]|nr:hypothetical protein [Pseudomonadales bacterium]
IVGVVIVGNYRVAAWRDFTVSSEFTFLGDEEIRAGMRSTHYEDMPGGLDRLRPWPRISSFTQSGSHLRLFLPYHPLRDDLMLRSYCGDPEGDIDRVRCLRELWSVTLAGTSISLDAFVPAQRADLAMRGLMGVVPLEGLKPGMQVLEVFWNPNDQGDAPLDDRYEDASSNFNIPFVFAPAYERSLD